MTTITPNTDYEILLNEINLISEKWHQRLSHHSNEAKKDIHDCYLCATIMYELERAKQEASNKIAEARQRKYFSNSTSYLNSQMSIMENAVPVAADNGIDTTTVENFASAMGHMDKN